MKKRIIIAAAITACLALCAAMWPQAETVGETPAVIVPEAAVVELKTEAETALPSEKRKDCDSTAGTDPGGRHGTEVSTCGNTRSPVRTGARTCPGSVLWSRPGASCRTARS